MDISLNAGSPASNGNFLILFDAANFMNPAEVLVAKKPGVFLWIWVEIRGEPMTVVFDVFT